MQFLVKDEDLLRFEIVGEVSIPLKVLCLTEFDKWFTVLREGKSAG